MAQGGIIGRIVGIILGVIITLLLIGGGLYFIGGKLILETTPSQVSITIDSQTKATDQRSFRLRPGKHNLVITAPGYLTYKETVSISLLRTLTRSPVLLAIPEAKLLTPYPAAFLTKDETRQKLIYLSNGGRQLFRLSIPSDSSQEVKKSTSQAAIEPVTAPEAITPVILSNIQGLYWSPNRELVLIRLPNQILLYDLARYNLTSQTHTTFGTSISGLAWDLMSKKIAYFYQPPPPAGGGEKSVIIADPQNKFPVRLSPRLDQLDHATLDWSADGKSIVLVSGGADSSRNLFLIDIFSQQLTQLTTDGGYFDAIFTPDSSHLIVSKKQIDPDRSEQAVLLSIDPSNKQVTPLNIRARLRSQTTFLDDSHLLAFDQTGGETKIVSTDLAADKTEYATSSQLITPQNPVLSTDTKTLFFLNDQKVVSLPLVSNQI